MGDSEDTSKGKKADTTGDRVPRFYTKDGKTYSGTKSKISEFADSSLKIIGQLKEGANEALGISNKEGRWLVSLTGFVFSNQVNRIISLKGSHFDGTKELLKALRRRLPEGTLTFGVGATNKDVLDYWHGLQDDYRSNDELDERICYGTSSYGLQDNSNYWFLGPELHIHDSRKLEEAEYRFFDTEDSLHKYATVLDEHLLNFDYLIQATRRFLELSTYFGLNYHQFKMAVSFAVARISRSNKTDETWSESNIGLIYSMHENCGKSLSLHVIAKGQGIPVRRHLLILSGGNQNTSGTSDKKVLEVMAKTSLIVFVDDPQISKQLGEFLNQIQSGLLQGSSTFGMQAPRASLLISSNNKEVERMEGRVIRFNYQKDESHCDNDGGRETDLLTFMDENKGLFVAWAIRYLPLWEEVVVEYGEQLRSIVKRAVPSQQPRWIKGTSYCIMANIMIHASVDKLLDLSQLFAELMAANTAKEERPPFLLRVQQEALGKIAQDGKSKILTWLNPAVNVKVSEEDDFEPAIAIKSEVFGLFHSVSRTETAEEIKKATVNGFSTACAFALNEMATLKEVRNKKDKNLTGNSKAHKIPTSHLVPEFVAYIKHLTGFKKQAGEPLPPELKTEMEKRAGLQEEDLQDLLVLSDTISLKVKAFNEKSLRDEIHYPKPSRPEVKKVLSPGSLALYETYTPKRKKAFEKGLSAGIEVKRTEELYSETENARTPQVDSLGNDGARARKSLFQPSKHAETPDDGCFAQPGTSGVTVAQIPEAVPGTVGVLPRTKDISKKTKGRTVKEKKTYCKTCGREDPKGYKNAKVNWVQCDMCHEWFHK